MGQQSAALLGYLVVQFLMLLGGTILLQLGFAKSMRPTYSNALALVLAVTGYLFLVNFDGVAVNLSVLSAGIVAAILQWNVRRMQKAPASGMARLYAVFVALVIGFCILVAVESGRADSSAAAGLFLWSVYVVKWAASWVWQGFKSPSTP